MSKYLPKWMKPKEPDLDVDYEKLYKVKTKFGMLGPVGSGKSTLAASLVYMCANLSSMVGNFYCRAFPKSSNILSDANNLRLGRFPEKTDPTLPKAPEAGLLIYEKGYRSHNVAVPICDVAGEISDHIAYSPRHMAYTPSQMIAQRVQQVNQRVVDTVKDCQGFIIVLSADDALMFREAPSMMDPDVYIHNVMSDIINFRLDNRRPEPHIIFVISKWDTVMERAKAMEMDVYDDEGGLDRFLANGFPNTAMLLKPLRDRSYVKYFRSWFTLKKDDQGNQIYWPGTTKPIIDMKEDRSHYFPIRPKCSEDDFIAVIHEIATFAK